MHPIRSASAKDPKVLTEDSVFELSPDPVLFKMLFFSSGFVKVVELGVHDPVAMGISIRLLSFSESMFEDESVSLFPTNRIRLFIFDLNPLKLAPSL